MKILDLTTKLMSMSEEAWMRHANPWSVWTRLPTIFLIVLAFWSGDWIGVYFVIPVAVVLFWTWLNPRIFPKPKSTNNWASKGVFGEKIYVNRKKEHTDIPKHHIQAANVLIGITAIGTILLIYGLFVLNIWSTLLGTAIALLCKTWFFDRMVWLFEDMKYLPKYNK